MGKGQSKLKPKVLEDLRELTDFTEEEIKDYYAGFRKDCPDGILTREAFMQMYSTVFPNGDAEAFSSHVFDTYDTNGDGTIDFREFICALSLMSLGTLEQKLSWAYSLYDLDSNGYISRDELMEIVQGIYKMVENDFELEEDEATPELLVNKSMANMDMNDDQRLSRVEFIEGCKENPNLVRILKPL